MPPAERESLFHAREPCPACGCPGEQYDGHVCEDFQGVRVDCGHCGGRVPQAQTVNLGSSHLCRDMVACDRRALGTGEVE